MRLKHILIILLYSSSVIGYAQTTNPSDNKSQTNPWSKVRQLEQKFQSETKLISGFEEINKDFMRFYDQFVSDSSFHMSRIHSKYYGVIGKCEETIILGSDSYKFNNYDFRTDFLNTRYKNTISVSGSLVYFRSELKEVGLIFQIGFEKIDGVWYLVFDTVDAC